ncbi:hypothetical protein H4S08_000744 [Coemansia sp. RSA 1365]|nr:hypothetical protein H4S08_000744 [Coemansia sp. RSA 1365]
MASVIQKAQAGPLYYTSPEPEAGHIANFGSHGSRVGVSSSGRVIRHSRSFSSIRRTSMGARNGPTMPATLPSAGVADTAVDDMPPLPSSDSKYTSQAAAARSREQRRSRMQRRRTDGSDEISAPQRPSTSRASPTRKVTYSQYPDFETITDPFAKRDKIPRKSERPFLLNTTAPPSDGLSKRLSGRDRGTASDVQGGGEHGGADSGNGNGYSESRNAPVQHHASSAKSLGIRSSYTQDAQSDVPTPLRKRDKIPRNAQQPQLQLQRTSVGLLKDISHSAAIDSTLQMEPLDMQFPESPVTPTQSVTKCASTHNTTTPLLTASLITPVSPEHQSNTVRRSSTTKDSQATPEHKQQQESARGETAPLSASARPFNGHNISPRLQIDMDKVDTLYARRSLLFENKMKREANSIKSTSAGNVSQGDSSRKESTVQPPGNHASRAVANRYSDIPEEYDDDDDAYDDKNSEDYISFDQVLIPTAFKRLRTALEDPTFEVDEKTYRRFKLSERWYAREERLQLERTIGNATLGKTKARGRVVNKSVANDGSRPQLLLKEDCKISQSQAPNGDVKMQNTHVSDDLILEPIQPPVPLRMRTANSRYSKQDRHTIHDSLLGIRKNVDDRAGQIGSRRVSSSFALAQNDLSSGYVPPVAPSQTYKPDRHRAQLENPREAEFSQMEIQEPVDDKYRRQNDIIHGRDRMTNPVHSNTRQQQQSSSCCGCTIM